MPRHAKFIFTILTLKCKYYSFVYFSRTTFNIMINTFSYELEKILIYLKLA
jgi:hypothetical protein